MTPHASVRWRRLLLLGISLAINGCTPVGLSPSPRATQLGLPPRPTVPAGVPVVFTDVAQAVGIEYVQQQVTDPHKCIFANEPTGALPLAKDCTEQRMAGGVAVGDYNRSGFPSVYVTRIGEPGILYRNNGNGTFSDVTAAAGLANGPVNNNGAGWADIDNSGYPSLFVTTIADGPSRFYLYHNNGNGTFAEEAEKRGFALADNKPRGGTSIALGDYDRDGFIDVFVCEWIYSSRQTRQPSTHARLLHNRGKSAPGYFEDVTGPAGVTLGAPGVVKTTEPTVTRYAKAGYVDWSFSATFVDLDHDGWPDLAIASDWSTSQLFWNNHDGTFTEGSKAAGIGLEGNAMGSTFGDYLGNGNLDWFVTSIYDPEATASGRPSSDIPIEDGNRLYRNNGDRTFTDVTDAAGVRNGRWGWGAAFVDIGNRGSLDIVMTNGQNLFGITAPSDSSRTHNTPKRVWYNNGDGTFTDIAQKVGITTIADGKGLAILDMDGKGFPDIFMVNNTGQPNIYWNSGNSNGWLKVKVEGRISNREGLGAIVTVTDKAGHSQIREIGVSTGFLGQSELTPIFGLGPNPQPVDVTVHWPASGFTQHFANVAPRQTLQVIEASS